MIADLTTTEVCAAIELVVRELLWEAGIDRPPVDAVEAAMRLGCVIVPSDLSDTRVAPGTYTLPLTLRITAP